jgi:hypothetical protein
MNTIGDKRSWSDAQLREAIEGSQSWRAVARALGLKDTSASAVRTIKRHTARLELDVSHFTGQRRWSDRQLREAVVASTCWAEVMTALGVADNGPDRVRVKGHATRPGLDWTHLKSPQQHSAPDEIFHEPVREEMLRTAAPAVAMAWFGGLEIACSSPASRTPQRGPIPIGIRARLFVRCSRVLDCAVMM